MSQGESKLHYSKPHYITIGCIIMGIYKVKIIATLPHRSLQQPMYIPKVQLEIATTMSASINT